MPGFMFIFEFGVTECGRLPGKIDFALEDLYGMCPANPVLEVTPALTKSSFFGISNLAIFIVKC